MLLLLNFMINFTSEERKNDYVKVINFCGPETV